MLSELRAIADAAEVAAAAPGSGIALRLAQRGLVHPRDHQQYGDAGNDESPKSGMNQENDDQE